MATQEAVITQSTGAQTFDSTYASARTAANAGDLIQIWADLTDEQILLKDGVDIWVAPGRIIKTSQSVPLILDNDTGYTSPVSVNITGNGVFRNSNDKYRCVAIYNSGSKVTIMCDSIEGIGTDPEDSEWATVHIVNAAKFYLTCNKVSNVNQKAIYFDNEVADININADIIENGEYAGGDVISIKGDGILNANEVICRNNGSCLNHKAGTFIANILKLTSVNEDVESAGTVHLSDGTGTQNLTLFFDEIQNLSKEGGNAVTASEGILNLNGRYIYSKAGLSMDLAADADILVDEIISKTKGININNNPSSGNKKVIIDANIIEGSNGNNGVVKSANGSNYVLRNAKIKNISNSGDSVCIYIDSGSTLTSQTIEIENLILVSGNVSSGKTIFRAGSTAINVKNLGLFVNKAIDEDKIKLEIGLGLDDPDYNYKYIVSTDIS